MHNTMRLELTQQLNMTQQLVQAVMILAMSGQEINELVDKQILENPVLELADNQAVSRLEGRWDKYSRLKAAPDNTDDAIYALAEQPVNLQDYLLQQIALTLKTAREKMIAEYIIGSLNESGYLEQPPDLIARRFNISKEDLHKIRKAIQDLDPPGFASVGIQEFLLLQLDKKSICAKTELAKNIVLEHLAALGSCDFESIALATGESLSDIKAAAETIKQLNPRPINAWQDKKQVQYITPDIIIEKIGSQFIVSLNPVYTRTLYIQDEYAQLKNKVDKETKKYINKNLHSAQWIIKCLEQREKTIRKISELIVQLQKTFLESGYPHMRPLTLKEVAEPAGVHESTVSRAINNKYAQTPQGIIPLKDFFPAGVVTNSGEKINTARVKKRIAEIISAQVKISDKKISDILAGEDIIIARRTVAKYRKMIGLQASFAHKKPK